MHKFKVTTNVTKVDGNTGAVVTKDVVNTSVLVDRREGNDGYEFRMEADMAERSIDLVELDSLTYLRIEGRWAESDSASGIGEGTPAPVEFQISAGVWFSTQALQFEGASAISGLKIRNSHPSGKAVSVRMVASGG